MFARPAAVLVIALCAGCSSLHYSLDGVPFPVTATPTAPQSAGDPFEIKAKQVLWLHGLAGAKQPDVAALLVQHCGDAQSVSDFRVSAYASIWDWLGTHLSLGLVRLKTVIISGRRQQRPIDR